MFSHFGSFDTFDLLRNINEKDMYAPNTYTRNDYLTLSAVLVILLMNSSSSVNRSCKSDAAQIGAQDTYF